MVVSDVGDEKESPPRGLRSESFVEELALGAGRDRVEWVKFGPDLACGLGVVRLSGLKLCPVRLSLVLTLEFHFGLSSFGRGSRLPVGVAEPPRDPGDGDVRVP